jgi:hypothetical protein
MNIRSLRIAALLALLSLPLTALARDLDCRYGVDRKAIVDTAGATRVEIMARAGDLTVRPDSGPTLVAEGRACASNQDFLDQTQLHVRRQGDVVQVQVQVPDEMKGIGLLYATLDLTVSVPVGLPVEVTDSSGDMTLESVRVVKIQDSSGDISARGLKGDVEIEDSSGDIRIEDTAGVVRVNDSSGDIVIRGASGVNVPLDSSGDIDVERVSGDVRIDRDSSGDIRVAAVGGNLEVLADGSGEVRVTGVKGTVKLPPDSN